MIPKSIREALEDQFNIDITLENSVSGGSINQAHKLETNQGTFFLKWNQSAPDNFFEAEAKGLELLKSADSGPRIPSVIAWQKPVAETPGFLLLEFIHEGAGNSSDSFHFGEKLATLHSTRSEKFGLTYDNYIGSLPQQNKPYDDWNTFFVEKRINPQLKMAIDSGKLSQGILANWKRLIHRLDDLLPPAKPCLVHGDLWGGNYLFDENGNAVLIDPAVYYGHPEMDLAFSKMFGGFSNSFYDGYESVNPLPKNFSERVPVYNMYPLLVHVNLFSGHYTSQFEQFIRTF
ncbi:fructosamine kinase family protein [Rhodohalobacter sp. 614A]|uniref:fructosamine kinase family protein n=1 Tax=Rhodohalobacter sp. 614A TaxID=2908649 RepID=UPI001F320A6B|nr:fructosamine kinase family protein [Rhodohalobacter sp. 614A]